jgi:hypothetical protein
MATGPASYNENTFEDMVKQCSDKIKTDPKFVNAICNIYAAAMSVLELTGNK